ncbi:MAG: hypothetical protein KAI24_25220 [Planctomycetes bacterium]|nr:hypothetical protein [Planctomycetota bacterium]
MRKLLGSLTLSLLAPAVVGQCISAGAGATSYGSGDDVVVNAGAGIDMGFPFPIGGASYQFIHPSTNGFCWLSDGSAPITNSDLSPSAAELATQAARVAVLWDDLNVIASNGGEVFVDTSVAGQCTVTWANIVAFGQLPLMSIQCTLFSTGAVDLSYDGTAYQTTNAIVGISPGLGITQSAPVDLSAGLPSPSDMTFEEFPANTLDLAGSVCTLIPTSPGYVPVIGNAGCASKLTYGQGCVSQADGRYELFAATGGGTTLPDIMGSATAITFLRTGTEYTVLDSIPGTYVPPSANAVSVSAGDDAFGVVALSQPMPVPGGVTNSLQVCTNGFIHLSDNAPAGGPDYSPTVAEFEAFVDPTICGPWYDWSPNQAGSLLAEEVGGVAYVTWAGVQPYNGSGVDTFQYQFELATGNCTIVFDNMTFSGGSAWHTPLFGATAGAASNSVMTDWSAALPTGTQVFDSGIVPLEIDANLPVIGGSWDLTTNNIDPISPFAITFFGDAQGAGLPLSVIGLNAPGCSVWINTVLGSLTALSTAGSATASLPIPNNPALQGATVSAQSISLTLVNSANLLTSNGVIGTVGF